MTEEKKRLIREMIEYANEIGVVYQWDVRYQEAEERDYRPSECVDEANMYILEFMEEDFDMTPELEKIILDGIDRALSVNGSYITIIDELYGAD